jgi:hypothetical protein
LQPILKRLQGKAQQVYRDTNAGIPQRIPNDIFRPSNLKEEEDKDDLLIFGGKTHTVTTKAGATASRTNGDSPLANNLSASRETSGSPAQMFTDNPSFANVHPSLVNELNSFDEQIRTQIRNAHRHPGDVFGYANGMAVDPQIRVTPPVDQDSLMSTSESLHPEQEQHQQQFLQQMAQQRRELERRELERQQQQQNAIRQQVQMAEQQRQEEIRKQQHFEEQQRQQREHLRQQQQHAEQQRHMQDRRRHQQPPISPQSSQNSDYAPYPSPGGSYVASPVSAHPLSRVPSRAVGGIQQTMEMPPQASMQPSYVASQRHHQQGSVSGPSTSSLQTQYHSQPPGAQMYPEYSGPSPTSASVPTPQYSLSAPPSSGYDHHHHNATLPPSNASQSSTSVTPTQSAVHSPNENYHQYWTAAPTTVYNPNGGGAPQQGYPSMHQAQQHPQQQQQQHQSFYSPDASLRGIAAEDPRLQETWRSYMSNVSLSFFPEEEYTD